MPEKNNGYGELLYRVWESMRARCRRCTHQSYSNYGGRGISVCSSWDISYLAFRSWALANGYKQGLYLDRKDNDGDYTPENCRWVTPKESVRNRSNSVFITAFGETKLLVEWLDDARCVTNRSNLELRLKRGWAAERALTHKVMRKTNLRIVK